MKNLNYLIDHILYQIFKIKKKHDTVTDNIPIKIYLNKIENKIMFKINTGYYLELLTPETMELFGCTKSNIIKDENGENAPHLEIIKVLLVHYNIVNNVY